MADLGDGLRADLAERGWSADLDFGTRISFRDSRALVAGILSDPSTRSGSLVAGLRVRMSEAELLRLGLAYGPGAVSAVMRSPEEVTRDSAFRASGDEEAEALSHMSSIWSIGEGGEVNGR